MRHGELIDLEETVRERVPDRDRVVYVVSIRRALLCVLIAAGLEPEAVPVGEDRFQRRDAANLLECDHVRIDG